MVLYISNIENKYSIFVLLFLSLISSQSHAEPLIDNNSYTVRDKISTISLGYVERREQYKRVGSDGSTLDLEATCFDLGTAYGTKRNQATYLSFSYCSDPGAAQLSETSERSASFVSIGYLYSAPQSRTEVFIELDTVDYPNVHSSSLSFNGARLLLGVGVDIIDGQRFSLSAGYAYEIYSRYTIDENSVDIDRTRPNSAYLRASYLFDNDWTIMSRLAGTGREGMSISLMKSFQ